MNSPVPEILKQNKLFQTIRLSIKNWNLLEQSIVPIKDLLENVLSIMTPKVTKDLPDGWQNISTTEKAESWIKERKDDSYFYAIQLLENKEIIGFLFLYTEDEITEYIDLRLGYLLAESSWGKGIGSELIGGLVEWCKKQKEISSISGGVEINNIGSIRILEKNGFQKIEDELPENMLLYKLELHS